MTSAYVGLGGNLDDREALIRRALVLLAGRPEIEVVLVSSLRETDPVGFVDQPRFLNGAAMIETSLTAHQLLGELLAVERELGRTRNGHRYGPRTIDLDLLLYGDVVLEEPGLTVPHPRLHERAFVLEPLFELDPGLVVPGKGSVAALIAGLQSTS